jgi:hypothetical protein
MGFHGAKVGYNITIQLSRGATTIQLAYFLQAWGHQFLWPEKDGNDFHGFSRPTCWDLKALNTPMHLWLHNHSLVKLHPQVCMHI